MKYFTTLGFIFIFFLCFGKNDHEFIIGFNYPITPDRVILREYGVEFGYLYSYNFNNSIFLTSGIRSNLYVLSDGYGFAKDFYIPVRAGFNFDNINGSFGFSLNAAQFSALARYSGLDPELNSDADKRPFYDNVLYTERTFGIGFNASIDYKLSNGFKLFIDYLKVGLNDRYDTDKQYQFGLITLGLKIMMNRY